MRTYAIPLRTLKWLIFLRNKINFSLFPAFFCGVMAHLDLQVCADIRIRGIFHFFFAESLLIEVNLRQLM